jgi:predicted Holliday junction resolvase-like endonuclease
MTIIIIVLLILKISHSKNKVKSLIKKFNPKKKELNLKNNKKIKDKKQIETNSTI